MGSVNAELTEQQADFLREQGGYVHSTRRRHNPETAYLVKPQERALTRGTDEYPADGLNAKKNGKFPGIGKNTLALHSDTFEDRHLENGIHIGKVEFASHWYLTMTKETLERFQEFEAAEAPKRAEMRRAFEKFIFDECKWTLRDLE